MLTAVLGRFFLTLLLSSALGLLLYRLKMPGGMMIGALLSAVVLNVFEVAYMPSEARIGAQITAGAYIGFSAGKTELDHLRRLLKPLGILLFGMLVLNVVVGFLIYNCSSLDLSTSLFCAVPGGLSDIPIIAADMKAMAWAVAIAQFVRLIAGIGVFPLIILRITKKSEMPAAGGHEDPKTVDSGSISRVLLTMGVAAGAGLLGKGLHVPAGALIFSLLATLLLKFTTGKSFLPKKIRVAAQMLSGAYIGSGVTRTDLINIHIIVLPLLVLLAGYFIASFIIGGALSKYCNLSLREAMLCAIPAGASDLALIYEDLGIRNPDILVLQLLRMIIVVAVFPILIHLILVFTGQFY